MTNRETPRQTFGPDRALREVQDAQRAAFARELTLFPVPLGRPENETQRADCRAQFDRPLAVDPTAGAFSVALPRITRRDLGAIVSVFRVVNSANDVTLVPAGENTTIDGNSTLAIGPGSSSCILMALQDEFWKVLVLQ